MREPRVVVGVHGWLWSGTENRDKPIVCFYVQIGVQVVYSFYLIFEMQLANLIVSNISIMICKNMQFYFI